MLPRKVLTALSILSTRGAEGVARVSFEKAGMWWRHGKPLEFRKFMGRPTEVARLDGCRFRLDSPLIDGGLRYLLLSGKYEVPERTLVKRWLDPRLPVVEFGASIGVVSCLTNRLLVDRARHVVVEANPALIPLLVQHRNLNGCRFTVLNRAAGHYGATTQLHVTDHVLSSNLLIPTRESVAVPTTTLQQILDEADFELCTLICDIEGAEVDLVESEISVLSSCVPMLILELHERRLGPAQTGRVQEMLREAGFEVFDRVWESIMLRNARLGDVKAQPGWLRSASTVITRRDAARDRMQQSSETRHST